MGAGKPCLGFPSRSAAIRALRADGLSSGAIAEKTGIPRKHISALESYGKNGRPRDGGSRRGGSKRPIGSDGLFEGEREILRLWESGYSIESIVTKTGAARSYVKNVISRLDVKAEGAWEAMVRHGTAELLRALQRHHPECGRAAS